MKRLIGILSTLLLCCQMVHAAKIDQLVFFGDSLTDTGNLFRLTSLIHQFDNNFPITPDAPYFEGRYSNGPLWNEWLAGATYTQTQSNQFSNFAYGGGYLNSKKQGGSNFPPSLYLQVTQYLISHALKDKENTLFFILAGNNDFISLDPNIDRIANEMYKRLSRELNRMILFGAKHFVVVLLPELSLTPRATDNDLTQYFQRATVAANNALRSAVNDTLATQGDFIDIAVFDAAKSFRKIMQKPEAFGFDNATESCLSLPSGMPLVTHSELSEIQQNGMRENPMQILQNPMLQFGWQASLAHVDKALGICPEPDKYVFWDDIHPTSAAHKVLASELCQSVLQDSTFEFWDDSQQLYRSAECALLS